MSMFLKAVCMCVRLSLSEFPILNARVDIEDGNIIYHPSHNISFVMSMKEGLIVPNVKDVEEKLMNQIAEDVKALEVIAKSGKLGKQELEGGTFALSNVGNICAMTVSPVVFPPQACIGATDSIQSQPVVDKNGLISVGQMLFVSWAVDHREIDGATWSSLARLWKAIYGMPRVNATEPQIFLQCEESFEGNDPLLRLVPA